METKPEYEIQQDNANNWRVIHNGFNGTRRAVDRPPCRSKREAQQLIRNLRADAEAERRGEARCS